MIVYAELVEAWQTLQLRLRCAVNAYRAAMQYKGSPGERPRDVASEQIRLFLEAVEREYRITCHEPVERPSKPRGYFHKEF